MSEKLTLDRISTIKMALSAVAPEARDDISALCDLALSAADAEQRGRAAGLAEAVKVTEGYVREYQAQIKRLQVALPSHPGPERTKGLEDIAYDSGLLETAAEIAKSINAISPSPDHVLVPAFHMGQRVEKVSGSSWRGKIVGTYSTELTPEGYAVESENEPGSVQIYPAKALCAMITEVK